MMTPVEIAFNDAGDTFMTSPFQLVQWKHALRLEAHGMTMSRRVEVSTHLRKLMGLKRTVPIAELSAWVESTLDDVNEQLGVAA